MFCFVLFFVPCFSPFLFCFPLFSSFFFVCVLLWKTSAIATATARAQAGNVRRELLESREELSRAVAGGVKDPVGAAFRECFEGQLIPRIQARGNLLLSVSTFHTIGFIPARSHGKSRWSPVGAHGNPWDVPGEPTVSRDIVDRRDVQMATEGRNAPCSFDQTEIVFVIARICFPQSFCFSYAVFLFSSPFCFRFRSCFFSSR